MKNSLEDAWDNLRDLFKSDDWSNELWDAYRELQIQLSMQGVSIDNTEECLKRLKNLEKRVDELEAKIRDTYIVAKAARDFVANEIRKFANDLIVNHIPLKSVA